MVVYTCQCLNVKVHSSTATEVADPNGFTRVLALGLAGVHLEYAKLARARYLPSANGDGRTGQVVLRCANCENDVLATGVDGSSDLAEADENARLQYVVATKGKLFLHSSAITSSEADEVRLTTAYSELFRIVLNDKHAQDRDNYRDLAIDGEFDAVLRSLDNTVKSVFAQKEQQMQDRVRKFMQQQQEAFDEELERAQQERHKLWDTICVVNSDRLLNQKLKPVAPVGSSDADVAAAAAAAIAKPAVVVSTVEADVHDAMESFVSEIAKQRSRASSGAQGAEPIAPISTAAPAVTTAEVPSIVADKPVSLLKVRDAAPTRRRATSESDAPALFHLEEEDDTTTTKDSDASDEEEEGEEEEEEESDAGSFVNAPPPSMANASILGTSVAIDIMRPNKVQTANSNSKNLLSQSVVNRAFQSLVNDPNIFVDSIAASLKPGSTVSAAALAEEIAAAALTEEGSITPIDDDDDDEDDVDGSTKGDKASKPFVEPHVLAARTFVDETSVLFGERPRPPIFNATD